MKIINIAVFMFICFHCFPQVNKKGNTVVHAYAGTDWHKALNSVQFNDTINEYMNTVNGSQVRVEKIYSIIKNTSTGCLGLRIEHFFSSKFAVGLDFWYARSFLIAKCVKREFNNSYSLNQQNDPYYESFAVISKDLSRLNATLRFDVHLGRNSRIDPYIHMALGGAFYKYIATSSNSDVHEQPSIYLPVSFKLGGGVKFKILNNIVAFCELSAGGPLIAGGIGYKLPQKLKLDLKDDSY